VGIILGSIYLVACFISLPAILADKNRDGLLKVLNWWLLAVSTITLVVS
jgi:hypothetical protein